MAPRLREVGIILRVVYSIRLWAGAPLWMTAWFGTVADLWDPCFLCDLCGESAPAATAVSTWSSQTLVVWCRALSSADFAISHHTPGLSWWASRLIKVSMQPEWSSTFGKLAQETGESSEAKTTLKMHPVWDLPIWCMKDNQEMWISTEPGF